VSVPRGATGWIRRRLQGAASRGRRWTARRQGDADDAGHAMEALWRQIGRGREGEGEARVGGGSPRMGGERGAGGRTPLSCGGYVGGVAHFVFCRAKAVVAVAPTRRNSTGSRPFCPWSETTQRTTRASSETQSGYDRTRWDTGPDIHFFIPCTRAFICW